MRRLLYAVAAVLAAAPLAAVAPASAAVQHSAAAPAKCAGGWRVVTIRNTNVDSVGRMEATALALSQQGETAHP